MSVDRGLHIRATQPEPTRRVLVVDDEPTVREVVVRYLRTEGFEVAELADGHGVLEAVASFSPDLIVLDVMLPGRSGLDLLQELRRSSTVPVVLLTARSDETDRILGLELGADDYVVKPFSSRELVARARSVLRRTENAFASQLAASADHEASTGLNFGALRIDAHAREVFVDDRAVTLTPKEFDLLTFMASRPRRVFSRSELLEHVWQSSAEFQDPATVTVHVRRVRAKIEADIEAPRWIATVFGVGYRFEP